MRPRIVSLLASGTEICDAIGLGDAVVGISHECDYPEHLLSRPRVSRPRFDPSGLSSGEIDRAVREAMAEHGSVYEIDGELLSSLDPDVVLTQAVCEVCAVPTGGVTETVRERGLSVDVVSLDAHTIDEILGSIEQVGVATATETSARATADALRDRLDAVRQAVEGADAPSVLAIEWLDPPFAPGHWVPEMLEWGGGDCLVGEAGRPSRQLEWADLHGFDPDVLVIMPCGYALEAARADADRATERLVAVAPRAIAGGRAYTVDASAYFNRSGPRFVTGVEIVAGLVHPDRWPQPDPSVAGVWRPSA